jgi:hypothetical protein
MVAISAMVLVLSYFGVIDKNGHVNLIANEMISNQTGIPLEELEKIEGICIKEAR